MVRAIEAAFAAEDVIIAEVGAWRNMLDPDCWTPTRKKGAITFVTSPNVWRWPKQSARDAASASAGRMRMSMTLEVTTRESDGRAGASNGGLKDLRLS